MGVQLGLSQAQKAFRKNVLGGSDANIIMNGSAEQVLRLWREKTGQIEPENLDDVLQVIMGQWTEELNRFWFHKQTGRLVTDAGSEGLSLDYPWMACTLDGLTDEKTCVWEGKHVSAFFKDDEIVSKYMPQLHHNMIVTDVDHAVLSVFFGNHKWVAFDVEFDTEYAAALIEAEKAFWSCVSAGTAPVDLPDVLTPKAKAANRCEIIDLSASEDFATLAAEWLADRDAAARHEKATKQIKSFLDDDVLEASGHGVIVKFNRNNAMSIKKAA